jgi:hypothetical protein
MKIRVLKDTKAASCVKGIKTELYLSGEVYDIFDDLAKVFIKEGWGENIEEKAEEKALPKLENKAIEKVEEDKKDKVKKATKKKSKK